MSEFLASGGWFIFILIVCYCIPIAICAIILCICVGMPGCLLHNQEIRFRSTNGRIITRAKKRINNIRRETPRSNEPSTSWQSANRHPPEPAPSVIVYKPTVPVSTIRHTPTHHPPTHLTLRDIAEASDILKRSQRSVSPTVPLDNTQFEPPPPYNEVITSSPSAPNREKFDY